MLLKNICFNLSFYNIDYNWLNIKLTSKLINRYIIDIFNIYYTSFISIKKINTVRINFLSKVRLL